MVEQRDGGEGGGLLAEVCTFILLILAQVAILKSNSIN